MRLKATIGLLILCALVAAALSLRDAARTASAPALIFSGLTNEGRIAVFSLTNPSALRRLDVWLVSAGPTWPNRLGDCQIKARTGDWVDCAVSTCNPNIKAFRPARADESWVHYGTSGPMTVHASMRRTIPPRGSLTVLMEPPPGVQSMRIGGVETNVAELHSPWRAGIRCLVSYRWPKSLELLFAPSRERNIKYWLDWKFKYPPETIKVWSGEVPR